MRGAADTFMELYTEAIQLLCCCRRTSRQQWSMQRAKSGAFLAGRLSSGSCPLLAVSGESQVNNRVLAANDCLLLVV